MVIPTYISNRNIQYICRKTNLIQRNGEIKHEKLHTKFDP